MGDKSTRKEGGKTAPAKTLKEKRTAKADKRAASSRVENTDAVSRGRSARRRLRSTSWSSELACDAPPAVSRCSRTEHDVLAH